MDLGQGDDRLPGTDRMLTDVAMVPPILMAGIKSASYKTKKSDRATLEWRYSANEERVHLNTSNRLP